MFGCLEVSEELWLRMLKAENPRLKKVLAEAMLKDMAGRKGDLRRTARGCSVSA